MVRVEVLISVPSLSVEPVEVVLSLLSNGKKVISYKLRTTMKYLYVIIFILETY